MMGLEVELTREKEREKKRDGKTLPCMKVFCCFFGFFFYTMKLINIWCDEERLTRCLLLQCANQAHSCMAQCLCELLTSCDTEDLHDGCVLCKSPRHCHTTRHCLKWDTGKWKCVVGTHTVVCPVCRRDQTRSLLSGLPCWWWRSKPMCARLVVSDEERIYWSWTHISHGGLFP